MSIESVMLSNYLILLPTSLLPSVFPSIRVFSSESVLSPSDQSIRASASVLPMNIQGWLPLSLTGLILQSKRLSRVFSSTTVKKHQFFGIQSSLWSSSLIHTWLLEKTLVLTRWTFVYKVMSLLFNTVSRFVIAFLPRSKHLSILWLIA